MSTHSKANLHLAPKVDTRMGRGVRGLAGRETFLHWVDGEAGHIEKPNAVGEQHRFQRRRIPSPRCPG